MAEPVEVRRNPEVDYERSDLSLSVVAMVALGILVLLGVTPLIMIGAFPLTRGDVDRRLTITPPEPRLQTDPAADLAAYLRKEHQLLDSYGWVDRSHGIARVPIEEAMRRLAREGIPGFPRAPAPESPQASSQPQAPGESPTSGSSPSGSPSESRSPDQPPAHAPPRSREHRR